MKVIDDNILTRVINVHLKVGVIYSLFSIIAKSSLKRIVGVLIVHVSVAIGSITFPCMSGQWRKFDPVPMVCGRNGPNVCGHGES